MKFTVVLILFLSPLQIFSQENDTIILRGNYQGKNLFVLNPTGTGTNCAQKFIVNGDEIVCEQTSANEIRLTEAQGISEIGDPVEVLIIHRGNCRPKVLNPEVLIPLSSYKIISFTCDETGTLNWKAENENGKQTYIIEKFVWHKWIKIGEVKEKRAGQNEYDYQVKLHSGVNIFRLKQNDYTKRPIYSPTIEVVSSLPKIIVQDTIFKDKIVFSDTTFYELIDVKDNILFSGWSSSIDCKRLFKHYPYTLNFDGRSTTVQKGKRLRRKYKT